MRCAPVRRRRAAANIIWAVRGVRPVSGEPQLFVVGAGHHLYRSGWPSAGAQAGRDPVHCQDGAARARARRCATTITKTSTAPPPRATPLRRSARWALKCWALWAKHRCSRRCVWRRSRWSAGRRVGAGSEPHGLPVRPVRCAGRAGSRPRSCWKSCGRKTPTSCAAAPAAGLAEAGADALCGCWSFPAA